MINIFYHSMKGMAIGGGKKIDENIDENIILIVDL